METPRSEDENSDEEGLGEGGEAPIGKKTKKNKKRAFAISGEPLKPEELKEQLDLIPLVTKAPEVEEQLQNVVSRSPLLKGLSSELRNLVVQAVTGPIMYNTGDIIFNQNDVGDNYYLIESGTVDVSIARGKNASTLVHTYSAGDGFGELALMYNAPRSATCCASESCTVWALSRFAFKSIVVYNTIRKRETYLSFLRTVPVLTSLSEMELLALADAVNEEQFSNGEEICRQGESGNTFYIVMAGEAVCSQIDEQNSAITAGTVVAVLSPGHYFGEIALMTRKPRTATVAAPNNGSVTVMSLDRATFKRVLGPLQDIMQRNMNEFYKFSAQSI